MSHVHTLKIFRHETNKIVGFISQLNCWHLWFRHNTIQKLTVHDWTTQSRALSAHVAVDDKAAASSLKKLVLVSSLFFHITIRWCNRNQVMAMWPGLSPKHVPIFHLLLDVNINVYFGRLDQEECILLAMKGSL